MDPVLKKILISVSIGLHLAGSVSAATLAAYDFAAGSQTSTTTIPNTTVSQFTAGSGLGVRNDGSGAVSGTPGYDQGHARANAAFVVGSGAVAGAETTAVSLNEYFSFTVGPAAGYMLNLEQLTFTTSYYNTAASSFATFFVRSSLDGFNANIGTPFSQQLQSPVTFNSRSLDLTGAGFQGLASNVEFRIYIYDTNNSDARWIALDDVVLTGTAAAIPEPSSAALFVCATTLGLLNRRKR